ncbi:GntR family transcriptional regulator [Streptomyces montanus]|uniref:GntR family transcriptional regulator n=1 Tax=Streptomyces montanus TaxID=2580423 RepID=A0A5R9FKB2_9ACTN|nr:GntR family transcriptional regulator [Streptomyces montanus]TLS43711.1 GntR family transcriptional regulator [Streptomyces montanus]
MKSAPGPVASDVEPIGGHRGAGAAAGAESPLYVQIKQKLKWEILTGVYGRGEHLPPAGELGKKYSANKNTILRALRMLRGEGLIDFGRGRGAVVVHSAQNVDIADISEQLRRVVNLADASGISRSAVIAAVQRIPPVPATRTAVAEETPRSRGGKPPYASFRPGRRGTV